MRPRRRHPPNWCRWHETATAAVVALCAHCGTARLHVHTQQVVAAKRQGYIIERCPACHRYNAVMAAHRGGGVGTLKMEDGQLVREPEMALGRMG